MALLTIAADEASTEESTLEKDDQFLRRAIELAKQAREKGEDPFGAVLVFGDRRKFYRENG